MASEPTYQAIMQNEHVVLSSIRVHDNIVKMIEFYNPLEENPIIGSRTYLALKLAKGKSLLTYLTSAASLATQSEEWTRYFFR